MATEIHLYRPDELGVTSAYRGFSWTTLLFGFWPALFRRDAVGFLLGVGVWVLSITVLDAWWWWLPWLFWALVYNRIHLTLLRSRGWRPVPEGPDPVTGAGPAAQPGPPGWYRDPSNPTQVRFWNGSSWT